MGLRRNRISNYSSCLDFGNAGNICGRSLLHIFKRRFEGIDQLTLLVARHSPGMYGVNSNFIKQKIK